MINEFNEAVQQLWQKLGGWFDSLILMLPNVLLAIVFFVTVLFISRLIKRTTLRLIGKVSSNNAVNRLMSTIIAVVFVAVGLFVTLSILQLDKAVTSLLAGAGVIGLAVGLAFQDPIINTISGIIMSVDKPLNLHDLVSTNGYFGKISRITLRATHLRLLTGEKVVIPNQQVIQNPFTNYTINGERRIDIECGISYGDDLKKVQRVAVKAIEDAVDFNRNKPVEFYYSGFGSSSIDFQLRFWIDLCSQQDYLEARNEAIIAIKKAFDENDISIPFPIRTLDFGIKGGMPIGKAIKPTIVEMQPN